MSDVPGASAEHFDVIVVGAGISGIGAAWHLTHQSPGTRFVVLEAKPTFGGTWVTHRYPGVRSDSDLYTFGYRFKPWTGAPIASGAAILDYLGEVIRENDLSAHIRYGQHIESAEWSDVTRQWQLQVRCADTGTRRSFTCRFLWMCQGYYRHDAGYTPHWPGMADFGGRIVHPQTWPRDLDTRDQRVVIIGSGATAATLLPALAGQCAHVTLLQRSPTYFRSARNNVELADQMRAWEVPEAWIHEIVRRKILHEQRAFQKWAQRDPDAVRAELLADVRARLGPGFDVERHFGPRYRPWQQRLAFVPDGDLFAAVRRRDASVVTDEIDCFTRTGLRLCSGAALAADIIVTATGFELSALGDIAFRINGRALDFHDTVAWHGALFTGVPNLVWVFGYLRWSWTLRVDLLGDLVCRLLAHMRATGATRVLPQLRPEDASMPLRPWIEPDNFNPGYLARGMHLLPRQGNVAPWRHDQDYWSDRQQLPAAAFDDGTLRFD